MAISADRGQAYRSMGLKPAIAASGWVTAHGGSKLRPEAMEAMNEATTVMISIADLNVAAGKAIAEATGAEAGFVSSGAAGGLVLQAAAVIAGSDPAKMAQLPDATGLKNEIIIQRSHRFAYDGCYRTAGAKLVDIGDGRSCLPWQLEAAFTEKTAAVAYLFSTHLTRRALSLEQVCEAAHARGVPVIVDGASLLPPRANLRRFIAEGADMVIYSGGKGVRGPQGTGILCGRADLIEAAAANASPNRFVARGMKVAKEEIIGLITALDVFVNEDEDAENARYRLMGQAVVDAMVEIPGLTVAIEHDAYENLVPSAVITLTDKWQGPEKAQIIAAMGGGENPILLSDFGNPDELTVSPSNLDKDELELVIRRLREELLADPR